MDKVQMNHEIREMYANNESFDKEDVKNNHEALHQEIVDKYEDFDKGLKLHGITKKKLKERQKFFLYHVMKNRYEKFGEEALRPKNIEEDMKRQIVDVYATIKNLKQTIKTWDEDRVMYELRTNFITGNNFSHIRKEGGKLYREIEAKFGGLEEAKDEYVNRFGMKKFKNDPIESVFSDIETQEETDGTEGKVVMLNQEPAKETVQNNVVNDDKLLQMMENLGYITKKQGKDIQNATTKSEEEIRQFLMQELVRAQNENRKISEELIKKENHAMYIAILSKYGTVSHAIEDMTKSLFTV